MNGVASVLSMGVTGGLIALAAALLVATLLGVAMRRRAGQFRPAKPGTPAKPAGALTEADLGAGLGRQATLVQFSTAFCAPCRPTRQILDQDGAIVKRATGLPRKADVIAALGTVVQTPVVQTEDRSRK